MKALKNANFKASIPAHILRVLGNAGGDIFGNEMVSGDDPILSDSEWERIVSKRDHLDRNDELLEPREVIIRGISNDNSYGDHHNYFVHEVCGVEPVEIRQVLSDGRKRPYTLTGGALVLTDNRIDPDRTQEVMGVTDEAMFDMVKLYGKKAFSWIYGKVEIIGLRPDTDEEECWYKEGNLRDGGCLLSGNPTSNLYAISMMFESLTTGATGIQPYQRYRTNIPARDLPAERVLDQVVKVEGWLNDSGFNFKLDS